jgi:hypothetical protein
MVRSAGWLVRSRVFLPLVLLGFGGLGALEAQKLDDGEEALKERDRKTRTVGYQLFKGELNARPDDKDHLEAIDVRACWAVFPYAWRTYQNEPGRIDKVFDNFEKDLGQLSRYRGATAVTTRIFCRRVIQRAQEVIDTRSPIAAINATRVLARIPVEPTVKQPAVLEDILPRLADGNGELLATKLLELVQKKESNDGVKYHALRGLRELLALPPQTTPLLQKETEAAIVRETMKLIDQKVQFPVGTPDPEKNGYRVLRREAIRVLAMNRSPIVGKEQPGVTLLRVAAATPDVVPSPRVDERMEASIGLARLRAGKGGTYQPDYAVYAIGRAVSAFGEAANREIEKKLLERSRPWKVDAARWIEALDAMKSEVKNEYVSKAVDQCLAQLNQVEGGRATQPADLKEWLDKTRPPSKELYRGDASSAIKEEPEKE